MGRDVDYWHEIVEHASSDDPFWEPVDHSARLAAVAAPVLQVGGWYDIFLPTQLADHARLVTARNQSKLVIGPWTHTSPQGVAAQVRESLRWMDRHVLGISPSGESVDSSPVRLFVMGKDMWVGFPSWPPPGSEPQRWYLHAGGGLDPRIPTDSEPESYTYNPADPTPIVGGTLLRRSGGRRVQASTEMRSDVLVFTSEILRTDVEVIGEVIAEMHVTSDLEHFDLFVGLCAVDEKGRSTNICDGIERVSPKRWARSPDSIWTVRVSLWPTAQLFRTGTRIRVQVSNGAHPRFARNLGTGEPIARATKMRIAHQTIHHDPRHLSAIVLPVYKALERLAQ
jgi:uncharacterized protein